MVVEKRRSLAPLEDSPTAWVSIGERPKRVFGQRNKHLIGRAKNTLGVIHAGIEGGAPARRDRETIKES